MDAGKVLELLRPLVLVVDGRGRILDAHGGCGGFLGHDVAALPGTDVLDLIAPSDRAELAPYFATSLDDRPATLALPLPFRLRLLDAAGREHAVDVLSTGAPHDPDVEGWVAVLVPLASQAGATRALDAELHGASRLDVKRLLAEELEIDGPDWVTRQFLVEIPLRTVIAGREDADGLGPVVERAIAHGWSPWALVEHAAGIEVPLASAPPAIQRVAASQGWDAVEAAPVVLDGQLIAAYVRFHRTFGRPTADLVRTAVDGRVRNLVGITRLLYGRWRDEDALLVAARTDPLTGLANRDALSLALAQPETAIAVIYIDIDHFKGINDQYGHAIGDRVLVEVARRISSACRRDDVVARVGGDEFVVLLRKVDAVIAGRICRRILDAVRVPFSLVEGPRDVSVSIGLAMWNDGGDLLDRADQAMLSAKRQGRARLVLA